MNNGPSSNNNKKATNKNNKLKLVLIIVALGYVLSVFVSQQIEFESKNKALRRVTEQINQQQVEKDRLDKKMEEVRSSEYLERMAREQLGLARPDEIIFYDATLKKQ